VKKRGLIAPITGLDRYNDPKGQRLGVVPKFGDPMKAWPMSED
jgi:hypothetical protein